jgi:hypothetical protein
MNSIFLTVDDELSPYDGNVGGLCCSSYPEFITCFCRGVQSETSGRVIIDGLCFEILGIASVSNLCQSEAAKILRCKSFPDEFLMRRESSSGKGNDSLSVEEKRDIAPNAKGRVELIG